MFTQTKETQENTSPKQALQILKDGNKRFEQNIKFQRDLSLQVRETSEGQHPFAAILSCIDSRVPAELVFDQGIGDIFSIRVAGNIVNEDILGSLEYSCKVAGSKIIVVLGHTKCGAVNAACNKVELGNITLLLQKITAANEIIGDNSRDLNSEMIEAVGIKNIKDSVQRIKEGSSILSEMLKNDDIYIVGAVYNVTTGKVSFL